MWNGDEHSEPFLNEANYFRNRVDGRRDMYTESLYVSGSGVPRFKTQHQIFRSSAIPSDRLRDDLSKTQEPIRCDLFGRSPNQPR